MKINNNLVLSELYLRILNLSLPIRKLFYTVFLCILIYYVYYLCDPLNIQEGLIGVININYLALILSKLYLLYF